MPNFGPFCPSLTVMPKPTCIHKHTCLRTKYLLKCARGSNSLGSILFRKKFFWLFLLHIQIGRGVARRDPTMLCMHTLSVAPRVYPAEVAFLAYFVLNMKT